MVTHESVYDRKVKEVLGKQPDLSQDRELEFPCICRELIT